MIGDADYRLALSEAYKEHGALSARHHREPLPWDQWAVAHTWRDFVRIAAFGAALPVLTLHAWGETNPVSPPSGPGRQSAEVARGLFDELVLAGRLLTRLRLEDRLAHAAVLAYLTEGKSAPQHLARARRFVFDQLMESHRDSHANRL